MNESEMRWRSGPGDAEGTDEGECERGVKLPLARGGQPPLKNLQNLGAFSSNLGTFQLYFKDKTLPLIWK